MNATIQTLAAEFDIQAHEVRASLDLGDAHTDQTPIDNFDGWTESEAREVLTTLAEQAADRA
ncbi:hypothetical protein J2Y69_002306 [Microbacterium resistens]|uniref:Uncharacterized protein n=1 Tax=Microbacterium resistens TaxID=156977 RepID=A0ABU1SDK3_9MICO|nr:hypothetical protein [Microbacterium resistens]MDR6867702.1 hypothetical protein [Microbacterium resistens]